MPVTNMVSEEIEVDAKATETLSKEVINGEGLEEKQEVDVDNSDDEVEETVEPMDEKQRELLLFIRDLTNRPTSMKAPIVQIVKKDGTLKSGILNLANETTVSIDNLMNKVEEIPISSIEGIRILHM